MTIRKSTYEDLPDLMVIYREAQEIMVGCGNVNQWKAGYPTEEMIRRDIDNGNGYAVLDGKRLVGAFAFIPGVDPTYLEIDGAWQEDTLPYATIHRMGSLKSAHGIADLCFGWCWDRIHNLRVDTHEDNVIMRHCIEKAGFRYCGVIKLANGAPRLAYQKVELNDMNYALVTGASSGIGYAYARELASRGYNLIIVSNEHDPLEEKAAILREEFGVTVEAVTMDLSAREAPKDLHDLCTAKGLTIEFLVNNAGVYHDRDFIDDSEGFNSLILMLHVHTPAMLEYHFGRDMAARGKGYIINMSSVTSGFGIQRQATYSSTKGFLRLFSRSTYVELKDKGVIVTCVRPGAVATTLYNLKPEAVRTGLALGYIISPEKLARKGVNAAFRGRHQITPGLSTKLLQVLVALIPTCVLRLIRKLKIF